MSEVIPNITEFKFKLAGVREDPQNDGSVVKYYYFSTHIILDETNVDNGATFCESINGQQIPIIIRSEGIMVKQPKAQNKLQLLH